MHAQITLIKAQAADASGQLPVQVQNLCGMLRHIQASACDAVLRDSRKEVVIKVLKPGVEDVLATDLDFLYLASR